MSDDFASQLTPNDLALDVTVYDGKYRVTVNQEGRLLAYRHPAECPEIWRDLTGDGLVLALAQEVMNLRDGNRLLLKEIDQMVIDNHFRDHL